MKVATVLMIIMFAAASYGIYKMIDNGYTWRYILETIGEIGGGISGYIKTKEFENEQNENR